FTEHDCAPWLDYCALQERISFSRSTIVPGRSTNLFLLHNRAPTGHDYADPVHNRAPGEHESFFRCTIILLAGIIVSSGCTIVIAQGTKVRDNRTVCIKETTTDNLDAVGTIIADRPPHRTVRARLRIRLPPWMSGGEAYIGIRMQNAR